jgi:exonuclease V gamma subunit
MINEAAPLGEKPRRVVILVPHKSLGEWLSLRAARTNSIWMGVQVATLDEWMRVYPGEEKLSWMVFQEKQNLAWAQELASAFASYAIYRPEWLSGWLKNQPALPQSNQQLSSILNAN